MMKAIAARRFRIDQKLYQKGDELTLPVSQFSDLSGVGLVKSAPAEIAKPARTSAAKTRRTKAKRPK